MYFVNVCRREDGSARHDRVGECNWTTKEIEVMSPSHHRGWHRTLIHEYVHALYPKLRHGREFYQRIDAALKRMWRS